MPRLARNTLEGKQFIHVMVQGINKEKIFLTEREKLEYVKLLNTYKDEYAIKIIAYCILGGKYNAQRFIARYSLPHLMNFAANYADIVILRADNHKQTDSFIDVIENYTSNVIIEASNIITIIVIANDIKETPFCFFIFFNPF